MDKFVDKELTGWGCFRASSGHIYRPEKLKGIGGAVACDVHGKNHHQDGSLSNFVLDVDRAPRLWTRLTGQARYPSSLRYELIRSVTLH